MSTANRKLGRSLPLVELTLLNLFERILKIGLTDWRVRA